MKSNLPVHIFNDLITTLCALDLLCPIKSNAPLRIALEYFHFASVLHVYYYFKQVNKKHSLESWWHIGFEGNGGVKRKETRV